jgi:hypothetical protein
MEKTLEDEVKGVKIKKPKKKFFDYSGFYEKFKGNLRKTGVYKVFKSFRNYLYSNLGIGYKKYMKDYS